jgi:hypothetical protein
MNARPFPVQPPNVGAGLEGLSDEQDYNAKKRNVMLSSCPPQQFTGRTY